QRNGAGDAELYCSRSHHGPPVADFRDGLGLGRGIYSLRDRDGADYVKRRDAAAPDRHGSIDGAVPACSILMGEALIFALARSVLWSRHPALPPPALIAHLI